MTEGDSANRCPMFVRITLVVKQLGADHRSSKQHAVDVTLAKVKTWDIDGHIAEVEDGKRDIHVCV